MQRSVAFSISLFHKAREDDLLATSNELAYKILLAFFPFVLFLVSLLGFLQLDDVSFVNRLYAALPADISDTVTRFVGESQLRRSGSVLSLSLLVSVFNASNGFRAVLRGVSKAHGIRDRRNIFQKTALCAALMLIFAFSLLTMLVLWIFSDQLLAALGTVWALPSWAYWAIRWASDGISWVVLVAATAWMYRLACPRSGRVKRRILPGACATVLLWAVFSKLFGVFIGRFSNLSVVYGSIAGVFILIVWLNFIAFFLLLGNSVNAMLTKTPSEI